MVTHLQCLKYWQWGSQGHCYPSEATFQVQSNFIWNSLPLSSCSIQNLGSIRTSSQNISALLGLGGIKTSRCSTAPIDWWGSEQSSQHCSSASQDVLFRSDKHFGTWAARDQQCTAAPAWGASAKTPIRAGFPQAELADQFNTPGRAARISPHFLHS